MKNSKNIKKIIIVYFIAAGLVILVACLLKLKPDNLASIIAAVISGCFSGILTMFGVYYTIQNDKAARDEEKRIELVRKIGELIGDFEANQGLYFWGTITINKLSHERLHATPKRQQQIDTEINQIRFYDGGIRVPENHNVFAIKAQLAGISEADTLISVLDRVREEDEIIIDFYNDTDKASAWISNYRKDLEKAYQNFRDKYLELKEQ